MFSFGMNWSLGPGDICLYHCNSSAPYYGWLTKVNSYFKCQDQERRTHLEFWKWKSKGNMNEKHCYKDFVIFKKKWLNNA